MIRIGDRVSVFTRTPQKGDRTHFAWRELCPGSYPEPGSAIDFKYGGWGVVKSVDCFNGTVECVVCETEGDDPRIVTLPLDEIKGGRKS